MVAITGDVVVLNSIKTVGRVANAVAVRIFTMGGVHVKAQKIRNVRVRC
mgnify:CR=1 FL=1